MTAAQACLGGPHSGRLHRQAFAAGVGAGRGAVRFFKSRSLQASHVQAASQPFGAPPPPPPPPADVLSGAATGASQLLQSGSQRLQNAVSGVQLPAVNGVELPSDTQQAANAAAQAASAAAEGALQAAQGALVQLDVFSGAWFLDLLFWGVLATLAYSLVVLAPRQ